jgi:hypothetical protein
VCKVWGNGVVFETENAIYENKLNRQKKFRDQHVKKQLKWRAYRRGKPSLPFGTATGAPTQRKRTECKLKIRNSLDHLFVPQQETIYIKTLIRN